MSSTPSEAGSTPDALPLLLSGSHDRYMDYCLEPYRPRTSTRGKYRSENILWRALALMNAPDLQAPIRALQAHLGKDMTVWGLKHVAGRLWLELYVYDPRKQDPKATCTAVSEVLAPWFTWPAPVRETIPYMMFSFDLFADSVSRGAVDSLNLYLTGSDEHAGRSYKLDAAGASLDNTYTFLPPKSGVDRLLKLVRSSMFVDYSVHPRVLSAVIRPKLFACKRVCVAKKRASDGMYFSGVDVDQFLWFLRDFEYPEALIEFVASHREGFEHLYYDVGFDVQQDASGAIVYPKSGFYGTV